MRTNTPKLLQRNLFTIVVLFALVVIVTTVVSSLSLRANLTNEFINRGSDIAESIANTSTELLLNRDTSTIQSRIDSFLDPDTGVAYIFVVNDENEFISHTFVPEIPQEVRDVVATETDQFVIQNLEIADKDEFIDISAPVLAGTAGKVHVGMNLGIISDRIRSVIFNQVILVSFVFLVSVLIAYVQTARISRPLVQLTEYVQLVTSQGVSSKALSEKELELQPIMQRNDEVGKLTQDFQKMVTEVRNYEQELEQRVAARTQDLNLAAEIGRQITQAHNVNEVLVEATTLMKDQFGLYQVQIYLSDQEQEDLVLRASDGHAGSKLLEAGHTLPIDQNSLNGSAAFNKQAVVVEDTRDNSSFRPNPLLPDTRSETAVPMLIGDQVVGVLDLQSDQPHAFTNDSLPAFVTLAGQLAIAIQNSKLFTEQERLTAEMQSNANFLDTIIDSLPLMIFVKDAQDLRFLRYNQAGSDLLGIPVEELVGKTDYDFFPKEEADFFTRKDREVLETGAIVDIPQESIQTAHKGTRYLHTTKVPILDDQGQPQYLLGIAEDITERKAIESELTKFKLGMERSADAIFLTDNDGVITYVNDAFVDIYGYAKEEAIGQTPRIIKSGLIPQENYEYFWQTLLSGGIIAGEIINKTKDGRLVNIEGNNNPIQDESGQIIGFLAMHRDITERKQVEKTLEKQAIELQTVADLSTQVSLIEDPQKMLEMVVQETQKRFGLYHCHVFLMDDAGKQLSIRACGWHQDAPQYGTHGTATLAMDSQKSLVVQAALNRQAVVVNDVLNDPNWLPNELLPDTRSELAVPLIVGNKVLGVLDVQATEVDYFTANDIQIQSTLAAQIAVALENARAFAQANEQVSIIQSAPNIIATASLDGIVRFMNQVGLQQLGYSLDELIGQHVSIFDPPDRDPRQRQEAMAYLQQHGIWQGESTIVTKSGGLIPVEQIISLIRDEQGKPVMTAVNMTDITARKQAEEAIRRNETLMRTIIDSTPDWIFVKDSQHRYQMVNKAYAETTHLEPDALIGKTVLDIGLPREIAETLLAEDEALMESEETMVIAEEELLLNGEKRYQTLTKVLLRDESGQIQNMVGYAHDVTKQVASANEQKQLQQELEAQLERVNALQRAMTRESWQAFMTTTADKRPFQGFEFNQTGLKTLTTQDLINGKNKANEASGANGHNELISPVKIQDTVIGKIGVRNPDGTPISEEKRNLLISLTAQVAEALDRARLFEETELGRQEIETQAAELSTVNEISELVSTQLNINDLVNAVGDRLIETFSADSVYIALVDEKTSTINFPYFTNRVDGPMNVPPRTLDNKGGFTAQIYQSRQPIINNPVDQTVADAVAASGGEIINTSIDSNTYIGVPMIVGEAVIGVIGLNGQQERRKYDKEDIPLLTTLSSTIAVALQNAQQFEATQRRANRESMVNEISQKIQNAPTVESALQTAVAELGKALNLKHAVVRLNKPE